MRDLHDAHFAELVAAQEIQNHEIEAALARYLEAVQASREKLRVATEDRLRVWNGEMSPRIDAAPLAAALDEGGPAPVVTRHLPGTPEHEAAVDRAIADKTTLVTRDQTQPK
jgi:hypothetical protein